MEKGKIIVIEGSDGSGKQTQANLLYDRLKSEGVKVHKIEYPRYEEKSSALVRMYLRDKSFGNNPDEIDPYVVSSFYAVDRAADYYRVDGKGWKKYYDEGYIIVADRYTTANMVHQAKKVTNRKDKMKILEWIEDHEYNVLGLPKPDMIVFLNLDPKFSQASMKKSNKNLDLHEANLDYLIGSNDNAKEVAKIYDWEVIDCVKKDDERKTVEEISEEIYKKFKNL